MSGGVSPSPHGTAPLLASTQARADWRALTSAVLIGSGIGLALGAAYLAGGMGRAATDHARASRLAEAAAQLQAVAAQDRDRQRQLDFERQRALQAAETEREIEERRLFDEWQRQRASN